MEKEKEVQQVEEPAVEEVELTEEEKAELLQKRKKAALMSFIFGLVALVLGGGLLGIIFSAIALGQAKKAKGELTGSSKVFRTVGKVLGIIMLIFSIIGLILRVLWVVFAVIAVVLYVIYMVAMIVIPLIVEAVGGATALALL